MLAVALAFAGHLVTGAHADNAEETAHGQSTVSTGALLSLYLRQRRSSESKPVHAPHASTGAD
jgi:hypothetical protein